MQPTDDNTQSNDSQGVLDSDEIYLVSDGSLHPITTKAAFEWVIATPDRTCWIKRAAPSRTNPRYNSSFRVELHGINDALKYCDDKGLNSKKITIFWDSLEVIKALGGDENETKSILQPRPPKHLHPSDITRYAEAELLRAYSVTTRNIPPCGGLSYIRTSR